VQLKLLAVDARLKKKTWLFTFIGLSFLHFNYWFLLVELCITAHDLLVLRPVVVAFAQVMAVDSLSFVLMLGQLPLGHCSPINILE